MGEVLICRLQTVQRKRQSKKKWHRNLGWKIKGLGNSEKVQFRPSLKPDYLCEFPGSPGIRICAFTTMAWVHFLVGELRFCKPCGMTKKKKQITPTIKITFREKNTSRWRRNGGYLLSLSLCVCVCVCVCINICIYTCLTFSLINFKSNKTSLMNPMCVSSNSNS